MKQPLWAKREFQWLLVTVILAVAVLLVLVFEIQPLFRGKPPGEALRPVEKPASLPADPLLAAALEEVKDSTPVSETGPGHRALLAYLARLSPEALGGSPIVIHLSVDDCDRWFERAVAAGCTVTMPLEDQFWGDRYGALSDPYGHRWSISTHVRDVSAAEIEKAMREFQAVGV